ncbi:MAG: hypothetical protein IPP07_18645 [Holophagales bacterium]|nr:hypothetical protein [Holophagales bacterium]
MADMKVPEAGEGMTSLRPLTVRVKRGWPRSMEALLGGDVDLVDLADGLGEEVVDADAEAAVGGDAQPGVGGVEEDALGRLGQLHRHDRLKRFGGDGPGLTVEDEAVDGEGDDDGEDDEQCDHDASCGVRPMSLGPVSPGVNARPLPDSK